MAKTKTTKKEEKKSSKSTKSTSKSSEVKKIKMGDTVNVNYTGKYTHGEVFDSSLLEGRTPIKVTLGQGQVIKGFENGLIDMTVGEKKTITLQPEEAYGQPMENAIIDIPKSQLPENLEVGQKLQGQGPQGPFIVTVVEIGDETVKIDHNHPMAGKTLVFELEVVSFD